LSLQGWIARNKTLNITEKLSSGLSVQRGSVITRAAVQHYRDNVHGEAMRHVKDERARLRLPKMTMQHKGNWDEAQIDMCKFANGSLVLCVGNEKVPPPHLPCNTERDQRGLLQPANTHNLDKELE
jgi:Tfp pilus assembly protein FimT